MEGVSYDFRLIDLAGGRSNLLLTIVGRLAWFELIARFTGRSWLFAAQQGIDGLFGCCIAVCRGDCQVDQVAPPADIGNVGTLGLGVESDPAHYAILRDRGGGNDERCETEDQRAC